MSMPPRNPYVDHAMLQPPDKSRFAWPTVTAVRALRGPAQVTTISCLDDRPSGASPLLHPESKEATR